MSDGTIATSQTIIKVERLSYGTPKGKPLISDLSFSLASGQIGLLTGSNGIGKSTLLKILLGEAKASGGRIVLGVAKHMISYLPQMQNRAFHIPLQLGEVVDFSRPAGKSHFFQQDFANLCLLESGQLTRSWNQASGGERQKALLTMALLKPNGLIFLDEPLNHLDVDGQEKFAAAAAYVTRERGKTILMVSHGRDLRPLLGHNVVDINLEQHVSREVG